MKKRMLALALALGMLFASTMTVSAATVVKQDQPVAMKKCESKEFIDPAKEWNKKHMEEICKQSPYTEGYIYMSLVGYDIPVSII